ncbi:MAG: hypothetical protein LUI12_04840 [Clostridiales bacterium]|nr:hypothetical protein [Clostridiales bacterium]
MPIPYYDKNPDGSLGQIHYEGREYPKNIEVIDWQTYSFEDRKPDVIYIHNPYDNCNFVTSVHPRYYAANLKKYTEELVYIPYFVLQEIEPDDQTAIDGMKHFVWTPGVICADKVILQSEKMAQIYVNEYQKEAVANGFPKEHTDREWLKKKFLGLGSPKIDKVLNTKMEDLEIPQEWLRIIHKPDGNRKKIIFYNTGISALLRHGEKMLEKMQDVFRTFYENREEVALLWRPHPLIENTIKSMRPQLWEEYRRIVEQYRMAGWGIYDDTADMDRAVVLSDAYYGDGSSIVQLFKGKRKSVCIQNPLYVNKNSWQEYMLSSMRAIIYHDTLYLLSEYTNALIEINLNTRRIEVYENPYEGYRENLFIAFDLIEDEIWMAPFNAENICIFNLNTKTFTKYETLLDKIDQKFFTIFHDEKNIYLVGEEIPGIYIIGRKDKKLNRYDGYMKELQRMGIDKLGYTILDNGEKAAINNYVLSDYYCMKENKVFLSMRYIPYIISYDVEQKKFEIIPIVCKNRSQNHGLRSIWEENNRLIILGLDNNEFIVDMETKEIEEKMLAVEVENGQAYEWAVWGQNRIFYFLPTKEEIGVREKSERKISKIEIEKSDGYWREAGTYNAFGFVVNDGTTLFFQVRGNAKIYRLDINDLTIEEMEIDKEEMAFADLPSKNILYANQKSFVLSENEFVNLRSIIKQIQVERSNSEI